MQTDDKTAPLCVGEAWPEHRGKKEDLLVVSVALVFQLLANFFAESPRFACL